MANNMFSPGPWTFSPQKGKIGHCFVAQVWSNDKKSLADIEPTEDERVASATARLIASAPDLLAVLKRYEDWEAKLIMTDECWFGGNPAMNDELYNEFIEIQGLRNAAIKKAT